MSIFNAPSFYSAPDRQTYSGGDFFIPQEKYTFGSAPRQVIPTGGITATTTANLFPKRILPFDQGDGGDGGGPIGPGRADPSFDYETEAYGLNNLSAEEKGLTEEEQEALNNLNNPKTTRGMFGTTAGMMLGFLNPFTAIASLKYQKDQQQKQLEQEAREAAQQADFDSIMSQGNNQQGFYDSLNDGAGSTAVSGNPNTSGAGDAAGYSGPSTFAYGGRVPYMMGGLANLVDIYD